VLQSGWCGSFRHVIKMNEAWGVVFLAGLAWIRLDFYGFIWVLLKKVKFRVGVGFMGPMRRMGRMDMQGQVAA